MKDDSSQEIIVIVGFGWVGQANAIAFTTLGYQVFYYDIVEPRRHYSKEKWGSAYEKVKPLKNLLEADSAKTLYFITVGDRVSPDGVQDISLIAKASKQLTNIKGTVILRSTVLPELLPQIHFDFYLPEFLHEKYAIEECMNPHLFVIGDAGKGKDRPNLFTLIENRSYRIFSGTPREASYVKYLSNIWNALRISFVNEFGDIVSGENKQDDSADRVIDFLFQKKSYVRYGREYGGHCLPKDVLAFWKGHLGKNNTSIVRAIHDSNEFHKKTRAENLPEWFSSWELEAGNSKKGIWGRFWLRLNSFAWIRTVRTKLHFVRHWIELLVPSRDLPATKRLWNQLAIKNARFYSNPRTIHGPEIGEYEFREGGKSDYDRLIKNDSLVWEKLKDPSRLSVLDIGVGVGREAEFMADDFAAVYGIDISEKMIEAARKRVGNLENVHLAVSEGNTIPFPDGKFDFIFSHQVFPALSKKEFIKSYIAEIKRTLKLGGIAKIELRTGPTGYKWKHNYGVSLDVEEAKDLIRMSGLKILSEKIENVRSLWLVLESIN